MTLPCPECERLKAERDEEQRLRRYWDKRFDEEKAKCDALRTENAELRGKIRADLYLFERILRQVQDGNPIYRNTMLAADLANRCRKRIGEV